jgi:hypothetical protein
MEFHVTHSRNALLSPVIHLYLHLVWNIYSVKLKEFGRYASLLKNLRNIITNGCYRVAEVLCLGIRKEPKTSAVGCVKAVKDQVWCNGVLTKSWKSREFEQVSSELFL